MRIAMMKCAIVLCGGHSLRMGSDKCSLPFGATTMVGRVLDSLQSISARIVLVGQASQDLAALIPAKDSGVPIAFAHDRVSGLGPLEGLRAGLAALKVKDAREAVFVTGCDYPMLSPRFAELMCSELCPDDSAAVAWIDGLALPLPGVYRPEVLPRIDELLVQHRRSLRELLRAVPSTHVGPEKIRSVDPQMLSLRSANDPHEYAALLQLAAIGE